MMWSGKFLGTKEDEDSKARNEKGMVRNEYGRS